MLIIRIRKFELISVPSDHRKDKDSDYVIVRVRNSRTIAVIELKSSVSFRLGDGDKDSIAQLFYEVNLVCHEEKNYSYIIAIYGNYATWHLFWMDYSHLITKVVKGYLNLSNIDPLTLCSALQHFYCQFS